MAHVVCLLVPSATKVNFGQSPEARVTVALCVPAAHALEHVTAPVSKAVPAEFVTLNELVPELSVKHLIPVIVHVPENELKQSDCR